MKTMLNDLMNELLIDLEDQLPMEQAPASPQGFTKAAISAERVIKDAVAGAVASKREGGSHAH